MKHSSKGDEKREVGLGKAEQLSSVELAALVVDALLRAKIVKKEDVERAIRIATEEVEVRKALGDY